MGLEDHTTYLALCVLANTARLPECAALIAKVSLFPSLPSVLPSLLRSVSAGRHCQIVLLLLLRSVSAGHFCQSGRPMMWLTNVERIIT